MNDCDFRGRIVVESYMLIVQNVRHDSILLSAASNLLFVWSSGSKAAKNLKSYFSKNLNLAVF